MAGYSAAQVCDLLGLQQRQLNRWIAAGLLDPAPASDGGHIFGFRDLVLLRTAKELVAQHVSPHRVKAALSRLRSDLPQDRPLSSVQLRAEGRALVVQEGDRWWEVETGQAVFDFDARSVNEPVEPLAREVPATPESVREGMGPEDWFELGLELEAVTASQGRDAYRRCLELDPEHLGARINLGKLLMEDGLVDSAAAQFRVAHVLHPHEPIGAYNYGVALEAMDRLREAKALMEEAIARDAGFEDAYLALARIQEAIGDTQGAVRTLGALKRIRGD